LSWQQAAVLLAVADRTELRPRVWVIDEAIGKGKTTPSMDAQDILEMLKRHRLTVHDVDLWIGDRPLQMPTQLKRKSNTMLRRFLAYHSGVRLEKFPRIFTPRKWHGSVENGLHLINGLMGFHDSDGQNFNIHPRADRFADFCDRFNGDRNDPLKDVGDAGRYPIERAIKNIPLTFLRTRY
jgi:hypothetical protein